MDALAPSRRSDQLIEGFTGTVTTPADAGYEAARAIWNGQVDRRPAVIATCRDAADVAAALRFARREGLPVAVRGGGHHVAGHSLCDGGLVIDLSAMRGVAVADDLGEAGTPSVLVDGGARLGDLDRVTLDAGLLVPSGIVTDTGIGGLTLGGGVGWTMRRFGLTCDSLTGVEMVTADGTRLLADDRTDPELLWALRGGGGNFGVVTRFRFRTHRISPAVVAGFVVYDRNHRAVLRRLFEYQIESPRSVTTIAFLRLASPLPWIPPDVVGQPVIMIGVVSAGEPEAALDAIAPLRRLATPCVDTIAVQPFLGHQAAIDAANPTGRRYYWSSQYVATVSEDLAERLLAHAQELTAPASLIALFQLGGATAEVPVASCVPFRAASLLVTYGSQWVDPAEDDHHRAWTRAAVAQLAPHGLGRGYVNFEGDRATSAAAVFDAATYARLR
ncbi:MAG: FAD-binding oxidoreductase, partial [Micromonosporaceae bacterium]|nr:FAD-binding oxidoreductase [Micromonosporaceae bacterium]